MQNKLHTIFLPPNDWFAVSSQAAMMEPGNCRFCEFRKTPKQDQTAWQVWNSGQERIQTHGKREKIEKFLPPGQPL